MNKRKPGAPTRTTRRARTEHKTGTGSFAMAAECTVADASSLKSDLAKLLDQSGIVTLDISAVQRIDTAGLQVIAVFIRERESQGRKVQWRGHAPAVSNAAALLGLGGLLGLPPAAVEAAQ